MTDRTSNNGSSGRRRFLLKQRIGKGAFGEVYLAEQDSGAGFRRPVALKLLNESVAGSKEAARRMRDEARILGRLAHRNIVSVLDLVRLDERWAVVMDYVPGADLEQVLHALELTEGAFPAPAAFEVGAAVARALHVAWTADDGQGGCLRVIHRDIKPSNVRLTTDGEVKVLDFGVARVNLDTREAATRAGGWIGTERYMAPERILTEGDVPAGDVYSLGASVVELILGRPLGRTPVLAERHEPFVEEALAQVRAALTGPEEVVSRAVALLSDSLATAPEDRPTADVLSDAFTEVSRRLEGESLAVFSRRFVPGVPGILGYTTEAVEGVLAESVSGSGASKVTGSSAPETIIPDAFDGDDTVSLGGARASGGRSLVAVAVFLVLLLALGSVGGLAAVVYWSQQGSTDPTAVVTDPSPPPTPPVVESPTPQPLDAADAPLDADDAPLDAADPLVAEVEPAPEPEPVAAPVVRPVPPSAPPPRVAPAAPAPVAIAPDAPRVSAAMFVVPNAAAIEVRCGDRRSSGTASARISDFPVGECTVRASWLGSWHEATLRIERPIEVNCTVVGEALTCT